MYAGIMKGRFAMFVVLAWSCLCLCQIFVLPVASESSTESREGDDDDVTGSDTRRNVGHEEYYLLEHCHSTVFDTYYLDDKKNYITVHTSLHLHLSRNLRHGQYLQAKCYATIVSASPQHRLLLHFNKISINAVFPRYLHERLHIFDGATKKDLTPPLGLYGNFSTELSTRHLMNYFSNGSSLILYFEGIPMYSSFDAYVTSFQEALENGTCSNSDYFLCKSSHFCIPKSLRCDGQHNCGLLDRSDEEECYKMSDDENYRQTFDAENIGLMVGSSVSLLILMIVITWFSIICIKRTIMKRDLRRLMQTMPAPPDPDRLYMPSLPTDSDRLYMMSPTPADPMYVPAMMSPPPLYDPEATNLPSIELPPPYTDTEQLLVDMSGLPAYSSQDDLPTYDAAIANPPAEQTQCKDKQ